ncbi:MAG: Gfo/Idh/MocA family oxidoreductase [Planctomycetaceae bacterium]|nr:Gfo/Idh/MocA family oxidoreductase [Planctomycetaceae bacterium]
MNRREMLKCTAVAGAGALFLSSGILTRGQSPNAKLNVALVGLGNQGNYQLSNLGKMKDEVNLVALCDVDDLKAGRAYENNPGAKKFYDFRKMFDEMEKSIDAVAVSTPDHTHYHPAMRALRAGKHLYCEKPLAHSVQEIRNIADTAAKMKVATQLGCQRHTHKNMHRIVELIKTGAIGDVTEVHSWMGGERGMPEKPTAFIDPPETIKWDLWLGPCPRDWKYAVSTALNGKEEPTFAPYNWRFWWDFGTGETGNWACHILDIPYWALDLKYPIKVSASGPEIDPERTPKEMHVVFDYPARGKQPPLKLYWSHTKTPQCYDKFGIPRGIKTKEGQNVSANNLFIGTKGMLLAGFGQHILLPVDKFSDFEYPAPFIPESPGFHQEWVNACKGGIPATVNFAYSAPMAETAILGNTAYRAGHKTFDWNAEKLIAVNCPEVQTALKPEFRKGWEY